MAMDLGSRLDRGITLPFDWFCDPEIFRLEQRRVFADSWVYAGVLDWVAEPGQFLTTQAGLVPIVVVRDEDGNLNGFVNICRHRATVVADGRGQRMSLQCPYHAWTYGLDGCLLAAPRSELEPGFDRAEYGLVPVSVDTWGPFVFVNRNAEAAPLAHYLGPLPQIVADAGIDFARMRFREHEESEIAANWKAVVENYLECYHCPTAHPGFSRVIDVSPETYALSSGEWFSSQVAPVRASALEGRGRKAAYDVHGAVTQAQYHYLWPSLTISINPGHPNLSLDVWMPDGPDRTRGFSEHYFGADVPDLVRRDIIEFNHQVGREDDALTDSVQRGLRAGLPARGRLLTASEHLVIHFQKLVLSALQAGVIEPDLRTPVICGASSW